jgi:hypothetical protein
MSEATMDKVTRVCAVLGVVCGAVGAFLLAGCGGSEWSDDGFNTGSGANVNFTGFYSQAGGGRIVSNSSGAPITTFTLFQTGNVVEAVDNNGSEYKGSVGSPASLIPVGTTVATNGQQVAQSQVVLEGYDNSSGKKVQIVGVFSAVAVQDISSTSISGSESFSTSTARNFASSGSSTSGQSITTIIITPNSTNTFATGQGSSSSSDASRGTTGAITDATTTTRTFGLTRGNSQFELRGTWIEEAGTTGTVSATSPGGVGTVITTATQ